MKKVLWLTGVAIEDIDNNTLSVLVTCDSVITYIWKKCKLIFFGLTQGSCYKFC